MRSASSIARASSVIRCLERREPDRPLALVAAVLDLPGVVHHVPAKATSRVAHRPFLAGCPCPESIRIRRTLVSPSGPRRHVHAELAPVVAFRLAHVLDDRLAVTPTPSRSLAQSRGGGGCDVVEDAPRRFEQTGEAVGLASAQRRLVP